MDKSDAVKLLHSLLITKQGTYELWELLRDFRTETGHSLPLFGYKTAVDFLKSIPQTVQLLEHDGKLVIRSASDGKSSHIAKLIKAQGVRKNNTRTGYKLQRNKFSINKIQQNCKSQSFVCNADIISNPITKSETVKVTTNKSLSHKSQQLKIKIEKRKHVKESDGDKSNESSSNKSVNEFVEIEEKLNHGEIINDLNEIPRLNLQYYAQIGQYIEVCVSSVWNPFNFALRLRKFKSKLKHLMIEMHSFYDREIAQFSLPESRLKTGQLCAVLYKKNLDDCAWYRAIILESRNKNNVLVGLIDYGTIMEINVINVRLLHRQFGELPPQAFSGHSANIRPLPGPIWTEESIDRFTEMVQERDLIAGIVDLNYEDNWLSVSLTFTGNKDLHISDTLIEEDFAVFCLTESEFRICLPWIKNRNEFEIPIQKFWSHCRHCTQSVTLSQEEEESKPKQCETFFSYSNCNERLCEIFN